MNADYSQEAKKIFLETVDNVPPDEWQEFLRERCGDRDALRQHVLRLLEAHSADDSLFDKAPAAAAEPASESLGSKVGNYKLLQKIGEGGFGVVYLAEQMQPVQRKVALKIIKPGMDSQAVVARFEAERQALAIMDHPNIAKVFDGGQTQKGHPFFVMELVKGVPITDYCDANQLATSERLELFRDTCNAIHHAHQKGVIHRDIKPANVLVTLHDGEPVVKVIDFGIAKALYQKLTEKTMFTEFGQMIGTPQYMSPEQAEMSGLDIDTRSDIYSLSVLLYELLTGSTPIEAQTLRAAGLGGLLEVIREQEPPKPSDRVSSAGNDLTVLARHRSVAPERLRRELQGDLDWIVMKGLEKDRRRRYDSASDFARDILRAIQNEPVDAGPPSYVYRMQKWMQRNRRFAVLAGIALVVLGLLGAWSWQLNETRMEAQRELAARLGKAVEDTSLLVGKAIQSQDDGPWLVAERGLANLEQLLNESKVHGAELERFQDLQARFLAAQEDRAFALRIEEILINRATSMDLKSWLEMEREFRALFRSRGIDLDRTLPAEVAEQILGDRKPVMLTDALELWMGSRGQLQSFGGEKLTKDAMQPWAEAIYQADPDPLRMGIRKIVYQDAAASAEQLDRMMATRHYRDIAPRTLSWLSIAYYQAQSPQQANEVSDRALRVHPDDLMLNFDYALLLQNQGKWDLAIRYYMRCIALRPDAPGLWRALGNAAFENEELGLAAESLEQSLEMRPNDSKAKLILSRVLLAEKQSEKVVAMLTSLVEQEPKSVDAWRYLAEAHMQLEQYAQALVAYERCHTLASEKELDLPTEAWLEECKRKLAG